MKYLDIYTNAWEKLSRYSYGEEDINVGDYVVFKSKVALEIGKVVSKGEAENPQNVEGEAITAIERKAQSEDLSKILDFSKMKGSAMDECRNLIQKHNLPIKLVDVYFTFDDSRVTFAFIAEGRVDFRELLKDLNKKFKRNIRLQQLGIRDEIKMTGDIGCCGRSLCCKGFLKELCSVTSDLADLQQVAHRGSERLSGVCGRLKCCLLYEKNVYDELANKLPLLGEKVKTLHGKGQVIGWHVLKQTIDVLLDDSQTIVEVPIEK